MKTIEEKKTEALARMKMLKLHKNVVNDFESEGKLNYSEPARLGSALVGVLYWLEDEEAKLVREFEEEYKAVVYHVIHSYTEFGELYSYLYVSDYDEEWDEDRRSIKNEESLAYVHNVDAPECSEFGYIGVQPAFGGVVRTW